MFNKSGKNNIPTAKGAEVSTSSINLIGAGTVIEGDIRSNGDIRIDGTVFGHVISKAKVVIGATGVVEGDVNSHHSTGYLLR